MMLDIINNLPDNYEVIIDRVTKELSNKTSQVKKHPKKIKVTTSLPSRDQHEKKSPSECCTSLDQPDMLLTMKH